jgi:hypothetical protein
MATWKCIIVSGARDGFLIIFMRRNKFINYSPLPSSQSLVSCLHLNKGLFFFHTVNVPWDVLALPKPVISKACSKHLWIWSSDPFTLPHSAVIHCSSLDSSKLTLASGHHDKVLCETVLVSSGKTKPVRQMSWCPREKGFLEPHVDLATFTLIPLLCQWLLISEICFPSYKTGVGIMKIL